MQKSLLGSVVFIRPSVPKGSSAPLTENLLAGYLPFHCAHKYVELGSARMGNGRKEAGSVDANIWRSRIGQSLLSANVNSRRAAAPFV